MPCLAFQHFTLLNLWPHHCDSESLVGEIRMAEPKYVGSTDDTETSVPVSMVGFARTYSQNSTPVLCTLRRYLATQYLPLTNISYPGAIHNFLTNLTYHKILDPKLVTRIHVCYRQTPGKVLYMMCAEACNAVLVQDM